MFAVMPAIVGIQVEPSVPTHVRARVPIVVPTRMPILLAWLIPSVSVIVCARSLRQCHEHCRCSQQPHPLCASLLLPLSSVFIVVLPNNRWNRSNQILIGSNTDCELWALRSERCQNAKFILGSRQGALRCYQLGLSALILVPFFAKRDWLKQIMIFTPGKLSVISTVASCSSTTAATKLSPNPLPGVVRLRSRR